MQSYFTNEQGDALQEIVDNFDAESGADATTVNSIPGNNFRDQLPTYLTSSNPPDLYTYFAGEATRSYSEQDLLLNIDQAWDEAGGSYSDALRKASQDADGNYVFAPTSYYWWGIYYKKSEFEKLGITPPETWEEFLAACEDIQAQGVSPIGAGLQDFPWLASAWFDYINVRVNGGDFHLDLLAGEESFDSPEVKATLEKFVEVIPYFDPGVLGTSSTQSYTDFASGKFAMYLIGSFIQTAVPAEDVDDLGFFSFPIIDPDVPVVQEAPTDGFFASANTTKPNLTREFMAYVMSPEAQEILYETGGGTQLPANPDADVELSPLAQQGQDMLNEADQLTNFFNRDAGDALQPTADAALTQLIADPSKIDQIMTEWQAAAEKARAGS